MNLEPRDGNWTHLAHAPPLLAQLSQTFGEKLL